MSKVSFSIEGDYITDVARQRMQHGNWRGALKLLECVNDLPLEDQISILKGDKYLTGTNTIELLDDKRVETQQFKEELISQYGKMVSFRNKFYTPYASVQSWCKEDLPPLDIMYSSESYAFTSEFDSKAFDNMQTDTQKMDKTHPYARSLHYADDEKKDLSIGLFHKKDIPDKYLNSVVLFKPVEEDVPFFLEHLVSKNPIDTIKHNPWLETRGAYVSYPDEAEIYSAEESEPEVSVDDIDYPHVNDEYYEERKTIYLAKLGKAIKDYADNDKEYGWKTITDDDGRSLKVPGRAFLHYAIGHCVDTSQLRDKLPAYDALSPSGLKMSSDNPLHTDCWMGAGLDIYKAYDREDWEFKLLVSAAGEFQKSHLDYDFHLITRGGLREFKGTTCNHENYENVPKGQRILVVPHLGIEFEQAALACDAIICEQGGPMAHLVIVSRECKKNLPIIRLDNACVKFCVELPIHIDLLEGKINTQEKKIKPRF